MKNMALAGFLLLVATAPALAQVDTFHVFKDGPVSVVQPKTLTNIAHLEVPQQNYIVIAKTEIENNEPSDHITCELVAVGVHRKGETEPFAGDPVTVFVEQGQFVPIAMTFVNGRPRCGPDLPCSIIRYRVRCKPKSASDPTNFILRQTKITAHKVSGLKVTRQ